MATSLINSLSLESTRLLDGRIVNEFERRGYGILTKCPLSGVGCACGIVRASHRAVGRNTRRLLHN